jgi:hypothetical protein
VNIYFFTVNPDNPRCPDLAEFAEEIAKDPVARWSIPDISPYLQKIRKGERFLFLQQAGKGASKNAPRGIIGCGDILGRPLSGKFSKTGEAGLFVKLLFCASVRMASTAGKNRRTNLKGFLEAACTLSINSANLPDPDLLALEIAEELEAAIAENLKP